MCMYVCICICLRVCCMCVRCVCMCVCVCVSKINTHSHSVYVCNVIFYFRQLDLLKATVKTILNNMLYIKMTN